MWRQQWSIVNPSPNHSNHNLHPVLLSRPLSDAAVMITNEHLTIAPFTQPVKKSTAAPLLHLAILHKRRGRRTGQGCVILLTCYLYDPESGDLNAANMFIVIQLLIISQIRNILKM